MKQNYKISEVAAIAFTCFYLTQSNPIPASKQQNKTTISSNNTSKVELSSKSSLLSLLSLIPSVESNGKIPKQTIKDHFGNSYYLADVLATNQKLSQNFKTNTNPNETETITPTLADVKNIVRNISADAKESAFLRTKTLEVINSTTVSASITPTLTAMTSPNTDDNPISTTNSPTITLRTRKPVSLSEAEILQISNIANNRRQANYQWADDDNDNDRAAETAMKMMVKNNLGVEGAMKVMAGGHYGPDAAIQMLAENAAAKLMAGNKLGGGDALEMMAGNAAAQLMGAENLGEDAALQMIAGDAAAKMMAGNKLSNDAAIQMMARDAAAKLMGDDKLEENAALQMVAQQAAAKLMAGNMAVENNGMQGNGEKNFRVDDADLRLMEDDMKIAADSALKMMARTLPKFQGTTAALSLNFDDSDTLHTLNDSVSESGNIWQTYETAEGTTRKGRKCFQCQPEIEASFRDPRLTWVCGGYNRARRSFKSMCIMHMRNCQDGTMFVKLHDNKCAPDTPDELIPHGKTFFYDYEAPLSFESDNDAFGESVPSEVEAVQIQNLYDDFKFFGRTRKVPRREG